MECTACPRRCGGERSETLGEGVCQMPLLPVVARAALHFYEEPPVSGTRGSGTVFFSGCPLKCVFCQNHRISHENFGKAVSIEGLRAIFQNLIDLGAHNIFLVSPTQFTWAIGEALKKKLPVPVVYNTGGYDSPAALKTLKGKIDVYMPDMKYAFPSRRSNIRARQTTPSGPRQPSMRCMTKWSLRAGRGGHAEKGLLIRHLVLLGNLPNTFGVID